MKNIEALKKELPELAKEYSEMTQEQLLEAICGEVLDLNRMTERVNVFMENCTNMSKSNYTIDVIKRLIADKQEEQIVEFCFDFIDDEQTDEEIVKEIRDKAKESASWVG